MKCDYIQRPHMSLTPTPTGYQLACAELAAHDQATCRQWRTRQRSRHVMPATVRLAYPARVPDPVKCCKVTDTISHGNICQPMDSSILLYDTPVCILYSDEQHCTHKDLVSTTDRGILNRATILARVPTVTVLPSQFRASSRGCYETDVRSN